MTHIKPNQAKPQAKQQKNTENKPTSPKPNQAKQQQKHNPQKAPKNFSLLGICDNTREKGIQQTNIIFS